VGEASRRPLFVVPLADGLELLAEDERLVVLPNDPEVAISLLLDLPGIVAPKAIALTLYSRMFLADMFIHGVGGGRYDRIADGVIRRFYAQEPPVFTVASMTMYLPLGAAMVGDEDVTRAEQKLHRFEHNPDEALDGIECESLIEREAVGSLSREKTTLVARIAQPDADRKTLGIRIREINRQLRELLAPVAEELRADLEKLKSERDATSLRDIMFATPLQGRGVHRKGFKPCPSLLSIQTSAPPVASVSMSALRAHTTLMMLLFWPVPMTALSAASVLTSVRTRLSRWTELPSTEAKRRPGDIPAFSCSTE
jgi:hypothetical protein